MTTSLAFDFETRKLTPLDADLAAETCVSGTQKTWLDLDSTDKSKVEALLKKLGINRAAIDEVIGPDRIGRHDVHPDCLHLGVTTFHFGPEGARTQHVDVVVAQSFIATVHVGRCELTEQVRRTCPQDFEKHAKTLSFLLYELFDHLLDGYRRSLRAIEDHVERLQPRAFDPTDRELLTEVGLRTRDVLSFRAVLMGARDVAQELCVRNSVFVSETCRPYLTNIVGSLDRLSEDLAVEREVLTELLTIHQGVLSQRTNLIITRLTILNFVFLPLSFLAGVFGMNFEQFEILKWEHGLLAFWLACLVLTVLFVLAMRRMRWL